MVFCAPGISIRCLVLWIFFSSCIFLNNASIFDFDFQQIRSKSNQDSEEEKNKHSAHQVPDALKDALHGVKMGIPSSLCDNAKDDLYMDWEGSSLNYTCYHPKNPLPVDDSLRAIESCDVPKNYVPKHKCMKENIHYNVSVPTYGDHRPLWPVYGEYLFVPPQRWLHSVEHGAIVMLYNPCAQPLEVERLRLLVRGCLRRHIITPYSLLPKERPLALVAWGCKLLMNYVEEDVVIQFIKRHALHGPEGHLAKQGIYNFKLLNMAFAPQGSNYNDQHLCPQA